MTDLAKTISAKLANDYGLFPPMEWIESEVRAILLTHKAIESHDDSLVAFMLASEWQSRPSPIFTKVDP